MSDSTDHPERSEASALLTTLQHTPPSAPTACSAWQAHDIAAHLAAGAKEQADLIEHRLSGHGERQTRDFDEREAPFRAMDQDTLMGRPDDEIGRKARAYAALTQADDPSIGFTGTRITKEKSETHSRSEAALHRWDITADDDVSKALLAQPPLAEHAGSKDGRPLAERRTAGTRATRTHPPRSDRVRPEHHSRARPRR